MKTALQKVGSRQKRTHDDLSCDRRKRISTPMDTVTKDAWIARNAPVVGSRTPSAAKAEVDEKKSEAEPKTGRRAD